MCAREAAMIFLLRLFEGITNATGNATLAPTIDLSLLLNEADEGPDAALNPAVGPASRDNDNDDDYSNFTATTSINLRGNWCCRRGRGVLGRTPHWRCSHESIELAMLPLTALAIFIVAVLFEKSNDSPRLKLATRIQQLDLLGTSLFVPAFATLILALQWGGNKYKPSTGTRNFAVTNHTPRSVICGFIFSCCNNGALSVVEYYMPIYFQTVKGVSAEMSGIMVLPSATGLIFSVPLAGLLTSRLGYYSPFMILNGVMTPPATGLLTTLNVDSKLWSLILYQLLLGFGAGIGFQGPQVAVQTIFSDVDSQVGIAIIQLAQGLGPAIFVAAANTIFTARFAAHIRQLAPGIDWADLVRQGLKVREGKSGEYRGVILSYNRALTETFYLPVSLACVSLVAVLGMEWRTVRSKIRDVQVAAG
ncbi:Uncharacterized protein TPAR_03950 [Tolypocladium paradoxum]|uniref:HC-toxin efflux carrier TOXA n=1 Tax=Tolypocladium paradoxum TaxID=94208 RepID=A0A2S4L0A0_9HYPO|nr:Uncharacterized protein TPAR_03950 [Tolypocladium paradoxum]